MASHPAAARDPGHAPEALDLPRHAQGGLHGSRRTLGASARRAAGAARSGGAQGEEPQPSGEGEEQHLLRLSRAAVARRSRWPKNHLLATLGGLCLLIVSCADCRSTRFFRRKRGLVFAICGVVLHMVYYLTAAVSVVGERFSPSGRRAASRSARSRRSRSSTWRRGRPSHATRASSRRSRASPSESRAVSDAQPQFVCPACRAASSITPGTDEHYRCRSLRSRVSRRHRHPRFSAAAGSVDRPRGRSREGHGARGGHARRRLRVHRACVLGAHAGHAARRRRSASRSSSCRRSRAPPSGSRAFGRDAPRAGGSMSAAAPADLVLAGSPARTAVIGIDIAFRWLVVARRRLQRAGVSAPLVCCNGEHLPFRDRSFRRVVSLGTLEHCLDADALVAEAARVPRAGRSAAPANGEPLFAASRAARRVWGVGFVPRRWADALRPLALGQRYEHHRTALAARSPSSACSRCGLRDVRVAPAGLARRRSRAARRARRRRAAYELARRIPGLGRLVSWGVPLLDLEAVGLGSRRNDRRERRVPSARFCCTMRGSRVSPRRREAGSPPRGFCILTHWPFRNDR